MCEWQSFFVPPSPLFTDFNRYSPFHPFADIHRFSLNVISKIFCNFAADLQKKSTAMRCETMRALPVAAAKIGYMRRGNGVCRKSVEEWA